MTTSPPRPGEAGDPADSPLLSVRDLRIGFPEGEAVRGISFTVRPGETLALVGESGAGKSLTGRALLGMIPPGAWATGSVLLRGPIGPLPSSGPPNGPMDDPSFDRPNDPPSDPLNGPPNGPYPRQDLLKADRATLRRLWGRHLALVPQDASSALSPVHRVDKQLAAAIRSVRPVRRSEARRRAAAALQQVGIPAARVAARPHQYSGGMRQRAVIAMSTIHRPGLVVADEPTTALDPASRSRVLTLLRERCAAHGGALVLITHDMAAVGEFADRTLVMYGGGIAEQGPSAQVRDRPLAPYTAGLLACLPPTDAPSADAPSADARAAGRRLPVIPGSPPCLGAAPAGCAFAPRCPLASERCRLQRPAPRVVGGREVSCHRFQDVTDDLFTETA